MWGRHIVLAPGCLRNQARPPLTQVVPVTPLESTNPDEVSSLVIC